MRRVFLGAAVVSIGVSVAIVASLLGNAISFFTEVDKGTLLDVGWFPRRNRFDLLTPIVGTLVMSLVAMLVAAEAMVAFEQTAAQQSRRPRAGGGASCSSAVGTSRSFQEDG